MSEISRSALLMYSAEEMYQLVFDIKAYPEFLPGCVAAEIISIQDNSVLASLQVAKAGIQKTFSTKNTIIVNELISMNLVDGPFKYLHGDWRFIALDEMACKVTLDLEFEFKSKIAEFTFGRIFNELLGSMVKSFAERAKVVYGER